MTKFWDGEKYRTIACSTEAAHLVAAGLAPSSDKPKDGCELCDQDVLHVHVEPVEMVEPVETKQVESPKSKSKGK
jgi:hypothetical protein